MLSGVAAPQKEVLLRITQLIQSLMGRRTELEKVWSATEALTSETEKAKQLSLGVSQVMLEVRGFSDELEALVADDFWPLPKYREILFLG